MSKRARELLFLRFEAWGMDSRGYSASTRKGYVCMAKAADTWLDARYGIALAGARLPQLKAFLFSSTKPTARNRNAYRQSLMAFFDFLRDEGLRDDNPATELPRLRPPVAIPKALPAAKAKDVLQAAGALGPMVNCLVRLFAYTGMRHEEVRTLKWSNLETEPGRIRFVAKGSKERELPLHAEVVEALGAWRARCEDPEWVFPSPQNNGKPMSKTLLARIVRQVGELAGVERLHPHQMRHTFATTLLANGVNLRTVQDALGHSSLQTTSIYLKVDSPELRQAIGKLEYPGKR